MPGEMPRGANDRHCMLSMTSHTFFTCLLFHTTKAFSNMKLSLLATTSVVLLVQVASIHAYVAPSTKNKPHKTTTSSAKPAFAERHASKRKKWGVDNDKEEEYWFNQKIHTLGNTGFTGAIHAAMAPLSTYVIDAFAYKGLDIRHKVADELASMLHLNQGRILDLCCGVGMSTRALRDAFPNAEQVIGVDTSPEMIEMAKAINIQDSVIKPFKSALKSLDANFQRQFNSMQHKSMQITKAASDNISSAWTSHTSFATGNAEHTPFESHSFDLITIFYGFHEIPTKGRDTILREARRLLRKGGVLCLLDISPDYEPSKQMLRGEPYVKEYQKAIDEQLRKFAGFKEWDKTLVPGHVKMWVLQRA